MKDPLRSSGIERFIIQADEQLRIQQGKGNGAVSGPGDEAGGDGEDKGEGEKALPKPADDT